MFSQMLTRGFSPPDKIESQDVISRYLLSVVIENHTWEKIEYIVNLTGKIPSRDTFELTIELEGLDKSITQYNQEQTEELKKHYEEHKDDSEQLIVELKISKDTNTNKISIYDLSSFISFLNSQTLLQKIDTISKRIKNDLVFEVFEKIEEFGSNTIKFIPHTSPSQEPSSARIHDRNKKIESFKENTVLTGLPYQLTADDFQILKKVNIEKNLLHFFEQSMLVYSLAYISNNTEVLNTGNIQFKFNGYKTFVTPGCRPEDLRDDKELAYKIYSWTYSEGHCSDKLGLVRNIFTLNTLNEGLNLSLSTWHTIQSNYEIYLKDNVGQYLELKGKLLELISDFSKRTLDATDGFISSFQSSAAAFITFIVSVVAINGLKDAGTETIFSTEYFMISVFISIASALWLVFSRRDTKDRIDYLTSQTKSSILENYKNILSPEELNASIDPAVQSVKTHTKKRIKKYTTLWLLSLAAFLIVFSVGLSITKNEERKKPNSVPNKEEKRTEPLIEKKEFGKSLRSI